MVAEAGAHLCRLIEGVQEFILSSCQAAASTSGGAALQQRRAMRSIRFLQRESQGANDMRMLKNRRAQNEQVESVGVAADRRTASFGLERLPRTCAREVPTRRGAA